MRAIGYCTNQAFPPRREGRRLGRRLGRVSSLHPKCRVSARPGGPPLAACPAHASPIVPSGGSPDPIPRGASPPPLPRPRPLPHARQGGTLRTGGGLGRETTRVRLACAKASRPARSSSSRTPARRRSGTPSRCAARGGRGAGGGEGVGRSGARRDPAGLVRGGAPRLESGRYRPAVTGPAVAGAGQGAGVTLWRVRRRQLG